MQNSDSLQHYDNSTFVSIFTSMQDQRRISKGNMRHNLLDMLFLVISAVISGADDWVGIEDFGNSQINWLRKYRPFEKGIPSHDTLGRTFAVLNFDDFSYCFIEWVKTLKRDFPKEAIHIDGKRLRGSFDKYNSKSAIHMVSAFSSDNQLTLGQVKTDHKSNEITAIPKLLELIEIQNCIITIDAMGCQKDIAEKIIEGKADYILAVKENQKGLQEQVEKVFKLQNHHFYVYYNLR